MFTSIAVEPASVSLVVNGTQALTVTAKDQNGSSMSGLTTAFSSDNQSVATVSTAEDEDKTSAKVKEVVPDPVPTTPPATTTPPAETPPAQPTEPPPPTDTGSAVPQP